MKREKEKRLDSSSYSLRSSTAKLLNVVYRYDRVASANGGGQVQA